MLAFKRGGTSGYRLILVGIAISFLLLSITDYLLARARIEEAQEATRWLLGSLNGRTWEDFTPLAISLAVLLPLAIPAGRALRALELGDDSAHALGLSVERSRLALIGLAVGLVSTTTVAVGPIGFVALTAPQIARRLMRTAGLPLVCSALTGAALTLAADIAGQRLLPDRALPVGVMTGAFGGLYLIVAADVGVAQGPLADHLLRRLARDGLGQLGRELLAARTRSASGVMKYMAPLSVASV